jgi:beta-glucosidase
MSRIFSAAGPRALYDVLMRALLLLIATAAAAAETPLAPTSPQPDALMAEVLSSLDDGQRAAVSGKVEDGRVQLSVRRPPPQGLLETLDRAFASRGALHAVDCAEPASKDRATTACRVYGALTPPPPVSAPDADPRVRALLSAMTEDEKIDLLSGTGFDTKPIPRLGIPALRMADGPIGFRGGTVTGKATAFPAAVAMGATFDPALNRRVAAAQAEEAKARGASMVLGPDVNIQRLPVGGRNFEMFSEDPYLTSRMAESYVTGMQERGVAATVKHFLLNDEERERTVQSSNADDRAIREVYGAPFAAVAHQAWAVMSSYNPVNGTYASESKRLIEQYLRGELGYQGLVVSDWWALRSGVAAAEGGTDLEMPEGFFYKAPLREAVRAGIVPLSRIEAMDLRILNVMQKAGLLDGSGKPVPPYPSKSPAEHVRLALDAAEEAVVLLKNEPDARDGRALLPLRAPRLKSLAVIGPDAAVYRSGGGSSTVTPFLSVSPLEGLKRRLGGSVLLRYAPGVNIPGDSQRDAGLKDETAGIARAAHAAASSDAALVFVGDLESEDADRPSMALAGRQDELVEAVVKANPRTIVVLLTGSPVAMPWIDRVPAVLVAWYPGQQEGEALAHVLFGDVAPSGKLPVSFPVRLEDSPAAKTYPGGPGGLDYSEGVFVGQRGLDKAGIKALFPFGHGLSYTTFQYSNLSVEAPSASTAEPKVRVSLDVADSGARRGAEVVQLYVGQDSPSVERPAKELKGFARVDLAPGETKRVVFELDRNAFQFWDSVRRAWVVEPGRFRLFVGSSSQDIRSTGTVELRAP